jgi:nicotinamide riboside transporter PnuC
MFFQYVLRNPCIPNWKKNKEVMSELNVSYLKPAQRIMYALIVLVASTTWSYLLIHYTNDSTPLVDAFAATISLTQITH